MPVLKEIAEVISIYFYIVGIATWVFGGRNCLVLGFGRGKCMEHDRGWKRETFHRWGDVQVIQATDFGLGHLKYLRELYTVSSLELSDIPVSLGLFTIISLGTEQEIQSENKQLIDLV